MRGSRSASRLRLISVALALFVALVGPLAVLAAIIPQEDFEDVSPAAPALPTGWNSFPPDPNAIWQISTGTGVGGTNSAHVPTPDLIANLNLTLAGIAIPATSCVPQLSFFHTYDLDVGSQGDVALIEIQVNPPDPIFREVLTTGGAVSDSVYTNAAIDIFQPRTGGGKGWQGDKSPATLSKVTFTLPTSGDYNVLGKTINLRWRLATGTGQPFTGAGWFIDDVVVTCDGGTTSIISENFNGGSTLPAGFTATTTDFSTQWVRAATGVTGQAAHLEFPEPVFYAYSEDFRLTSAPINYAACTNTLADRAELTFSHKYNFTDPVDGFAHGGVLDVSTDGGSTFTRVPASDITANTYNGTLESGSNNPLAPAAAWIDSQATFVEVRVNLPIGPTSAIYRWRLGTAEGFDDSYTWDIDNVAVDCTLAPVPEIAVYNSTTTFDGTTLILDGETTPIAFGTTTQGTPVSRTFTVRNEGTADLTLVPPITVPAGFSVQSSFGSLTLAPNATTTFTVRLDATTTGPFSGDVSFVNTDADETPYNFAISGTVNASEISVFNSTIVFDGTTLIADGTAAPGVAFDTTPQGTSVSRTFTIRNDGTGTLTLTEPISVPAGFTVGNFSSTSIAPNNVATFTVILTALTPGAFSGDVSFANNDPDENPFNFAISGTVTAPEVVLTGSGNVDIQSGGSFSFGNTPVGTPVDRQFTVTNTGNANLTLGSLAVTGTDFAVQTGFSSTSLAQNASATFTIRMNATADGSPSTTVSFTTNDPDEANYSFTATGTVLTPGDPSGVGAATPSSVAPGGSTLLTVTVTPGTSPPSTGLTVQANLTPIGGAAAQTFFDNGTNGDATAGDNVFSFSATVTAGTTLGPKLLSATIADTQGRSSATTISLTVANVTAPEVALAGPGVADIPSGGSFAFGTTTVGTPVDRQFTVTNTGTANLTLGSLAVSGTGFAVQTGFGSTTLAPNASTTFTIRMLAAAVGSPTGTVSFTTNDANEASFSFGVSGTVTSPGGSPEVALAGPGVPDVPNGGGFSFGSTVIGAPVDRQFTVTNTGNANLTLGALAVNGAGFAVQTGFGSTTLGPGSSTTFTIRMNAAAEGSPTGTVSFTTNDPDEANFSFTVAGAVVTPGDPAGTGAATPSSVAPGGTTLLTVTVTPGTSPPSTGLTVLVNLTAIGGPAAQALFDNGTNGDAVAGNNVFSFNATVAAGTTPGPKLLPVTISDVQGRSSSTTIVLTVTAGGAGPVKTQCDTVLAVPAPRGSTEIFVVDQVACGVSDFVSVGFGLPNAEVRQISGFGSLRLASPLALDHAAGERVVEVTPPGAAAPAPQSDDDDEDDVKETEDERRQRERTNRSGRDDGATEGNVVGVRCSLNDPLPEPPAGFISKPDWTPYALIANADGVQQILLIRDAASACGSIEVGDYLEADGEKQTEELFQADSVELRRGGRRVR